MTTVAKSTPIPLCKGGSTALSAPALPGERGGNPAAMLEAVFQNIAATRMAGLPLLNPALAVEAVGFRRWNDDWIGVLITPWFMNLICLPGAETARIMPAGGGRQVLELPSGDYGFLAAQEADIGPYLSSSLFSPMFDFRDGAAAREVAVVVLDEVFAPAAPEGMQARLEQPVSRRGFLGALLRPGAPHA